MHLTESPPVTIYLKWKLKNFDSHVPKINNNSFIIINHVCVWIVFCFYIALVTKRIERKMLNMHYSPFSTTK